MNLIDSHAHIYLDEFKTDLAGVMQRSGQNGVKKILMPAIDSATHGDLLAMAENYPGTCVPMMGLHPCSVNTNYKEELELVENYLANQKFIAIGEIGLDFYWDLSFKTEQYEALHRQLEWAIKHGLPVSLHSRNATDECIEAVGQYRGSGLKGVFHCFSGSVEQATQIVGLGFSLGIGGVLTFKNSGLDKVTREIDLAHLVLETDAPYLAPVPYRGKRNESSYISYVAQKLADIKELAVEDVADITTANAKKLFGL